jgi:hypothetical protein
MHKKIIFSIFGLLLFLVIFFWVVINLLPAWLPPLSRNPIIDINTLVINEGNIPHEWVINGIPESYPPHSDLDWGGMNLVIRLQSLKYQGFAEQSVFKFRNKLAAKFGECKIINQGYLYSSKNNVETPSYKSPFSDSWRMNCWQGDDDIRVCNVIARYDEYVTFFLIAAPQNQIKTEDIEDILFDIDNRMVKALGK